MVIIVNSAFEGHDKNSDDETHFTQDIEMGLISINTSINSSNGINESPIDAEELDTSDNNTTNNTQTTAECDDKLLQVDDKHIIQNGSSMNGDGDGGDDEDDDSNSKENYDMDYNDFDENLTDEMKRKHHDDSYTLRDVQNAEETQKLVNGDNGGDLEDCDYYSDGDAGEKDILKFNHNDGDGIIANHFIGLYFMSFLSSHILN